jgi:two-component system sensor histidine kinase RegB
MNGSHQAVRSTLRTLLWARWAIQILFGTAAILCLFWPGFVAPLFGGATDAQRGPVLALVVLGWAALGAVTAHRLVRTVPPGPAVPGILLLVDTSALTALLALTGGAGNPFTALYFVPLTLATQVSPLWSWVVTSACAAGFAGLFLLAPGPAPGGLHAHGFAEHLYGMWLAFVLSGALVAFFVHRIATAVTRERKELESLRAHALADRHLTALGTLAAGAAHELGTPLATMAVLIDELPVMTAAERPEALAELRRAVRRCSDILRCMTTPDLRASARSSTGAPCWNLPELADQLESSGTALSIAVSAAARGMTLRQPQAVLAQVVRELVANAEAARSTRIRVELDRAGEQAVVTVRDDGHGMAEEVHSAAFDPFFSTRTGGMGMGLYLARTQVRQLGGTIHLATRPGAGTAVTLAVPATPPWDHAS